jgi:phage shock protein PspC (stress-responsive transcriptional regulator)
MTWNDIIRKLTSRKLWLAIAGVATGLATILGADASDIQTVAGAIVSLVSAVAYIVVEGKVDAAHVGDTILAIEDAMEVIENE